ncbi:inactive protein RESTRICTED TEV MOVEMENT 2-like [Solanum stenotomum]|uniref:inactive protein RESTRICTED TEV MOVEMENT 2-like n=1 Tax=Solanum stenotomum TaxID=172797 RepID=UPI0020D03010|nr:inactive protein RESTRICTED TEV MOVEMENT 2-like [Solanum stenotomum]
MDSKGAAPNQTYEDFVPTTELVQEQDSDTLLLDLTGFKKEQVRVQLTRTGVLKIRGQRPVAESKWLRFQKDFPVSQNCDKTKISAKFENGILHVKQPKRITSSENKGQELPTSDAQWQQKPADEPQSTPQKKDEEQTKDEKTPSPTEQLPKHQATNADKSEMEEPNTKEAKDLAEKTPAENTGASSTVEDGNRPSYACKLDKDAYIGTAAVVAEKLKMPRKLMNMTLIALLVLGIGLYISNKMKSNN